MKDEIVKRFNNYHWHDSSITSIKITRRNEGTNAIDEISLELELVNPIPTIVNNVRSFNEYIKCTLKFIDCVYLESRLNLLSKKICGDDISDANCTTETPLKDFLYNELGNNIGYNFEQIDEYLHFNLRFVYPSGEITILARNFELIEGVKFTKWKS